ncbi:MAG TPA: hypothetical protein PKL44_00465 [Candidatus Dojkabacteria bacterium]|nr:hypothetical protein [Candidatus Dojkabacteria bacterium]
MKVIKKFIVTKDRIKRISNYSIKQTISYKGEVFIFQGGYDDSDSPFRYFKASDLIKFFKKGSFVPVDRVYWFTTNDIIQMHQSGLIRICSIGEEEC